jgi:hypothetical protein
MESVYHIVTIRVNEISWAHVWRLRSRYLGMGFDKNKIKEMEKDGKRKVSFSGQSSGSNVTPHFL